MLTALACGEDPAPQPDVLLILLDTLRADRAADVAPADGDPAATWAQLAARGRRFDQAVAPSSWTLPSMAALFSGREARANRHAAYPGETALAEHFAAAGWHTTAIVANPLLTADNGFTRGFREYDVAPATATADLSADPAALRAWDAEALTARSLELLRAAPRDQPVFLYLHLMDSHVPYDPAHVALAAAKPGWSGGVLSAWTDDLSPVQQKLLSGWRRAYDGQIVFTYRALDRFLARAAELRGRPLLVAITSDHGEGLFDHARHADSTRGPGPAAEGYGDHGEQVYEEALRVPLLLIGPGLEPGSREERQVGTVALGATLRRLAGLPYEQRGLPLSASEPASAFVAGAGTRSWFLRTEDAKLEIPFPNRRGVEPALFRLNGADWAPEREDLSAARPEEIARLTELWRSWMAARREDDDGQGPDAETEARLRALGYLR